PERLSASEDLQYEPTVSADGKNAAWVEWNDERGAKLMVGPLSGGKPRVAWAADAIARTPALSPDGTKLAFAVDKPDTYQGGRGGERGVWLLDTAGGKPRLVAK